VQTALVELFRKRGNCELQLEATRATPAPSRFNYDAMPSLNFEVADSIHCRIIAFLLLMHILYAVTLTFDPVTLTFDLEQRITCDVTKLCTIVVTRRLQAERRTGSVHRPKTGILPTVLRNQPSLMSRQHMTGPLREHLLVE